MYKFEIFDIVGWKMGDVFESHIGIVFSVTDERIYIMWDDGMRTDWTLTAITRVPLDRLIKL